MEIHFAEIDGELRIGTECHSCDRVVRLDIESGLIPSVLRPLIRGQIRKQPVIDFAGAYLCENCEKEGADK